MGTMCHDYLEKRNDFEKEYAKVLYLFSTVAWYNGMEDIIKEMYELEPDSETNYIIYHYYDKYFKNEETQDLEAYYQIQVLWMMLINMFGDYGTSPRFGWIEDIKGYKHFLKLLLEDLKRDEDIYEEE